MFFLIPHSGCYFLRFWRILVPKLSILEPPWRPAGHQMASQIAQVEPKCPKKTPHGAQILTSWNLPASKIVFGGFFGTIMVDFGWILNEFVWMLASFLMDFLNMFATRFADCQSRLTRSQDRKHHEHTAICRNMQE